MNWIQLSVLAKCGWEHLVLRITAVIKKQTVTALPQKTTSVTFWIAEKCKNIIYEDKT